LTSDLKPTAVFAVSDHEAMFIYQAATELGMKIPDDLSVIGFADLDFAASLDPPLTTMRQKPQQIGRLAAKLIMDRIDGTMSDTDPTTIKVDAELIVRGSTAAPRQAS
jgi:LacI family transcriptional regulator, galactose operon repressor